MFLETRQLPNGTTRVVLEQQEVVAVALPADYCPNCPQMVIINGTQDAEYDVLSEINSGEGMYMLLSGCMDTAKAVCSWWSGLESHYNSTWHPGC